MNFDYTPKVQALREKLLAYKSLPSVQTYLIVEAERLAVRLHHRVCGNCRRFARQVELMRQASKRWRHYSEE